MVFIRCGVSYRVGWCIERRRRRDAREPRGLSIGVVHRIECERRGVSSGVVYRAAWCAYTSWFIKRVSSGVVYQAVWCIERRGVSNGVVIEPRGTHAPRDASSGVVHSCYAPHRTCVLV